MTIKYTTAVRSNRLSQLLIDIGNNASLKTYNGTRPTNANTAVGAQVLLSTHTCASTFGTVSSGVLTANAIGSATVPSGVSALTPTWFRLLKSDGTTVICDGDIGTGLDLVLTGASTLTTGDSVAVSSLTITAGGA